MIDHTFAAALTPEQMALPEEVLRRQGLPVPTARERELWHANQARRREHAAEQQAQIKHDRQPYVPPAQPVMQDAHNVPSAFRGQIDADLAARLQAAGHDPATVAGLSFTGVTVALYEPGVLPPGFIDPSLPEPAMIEVPRTALPVAPPVAPAALASAPPPSAPTSAIVSAQRSALGAHGAVPYLTGDGDYAEIPFRRLTPTMTELIESGQELLQAHVLAVAPEPAHAEAPAQKPRRGRPRKSKPDAGSRR